MEAQLEYVYTLHARFLHVWCRFVCSVGAYQQKFLHRNSGGSLLRVLSLLVGKLCVCVCLSLSLSTGLEVRRPVNVEATALGAAIVAGLAVGKWDIKVQLKRLPRDNASPNVWKPPWPPPPPPAQNVSQFCPAERHV